ncbi:MAG: aminoacyl-tRNA hydrolase [candidate division Zixibacteria bacterium]|nr:aminoacyl-tRNA hydrolase [candidate division Zixibacteria bacterium]
MYLRMVRLVVGLGNPGKSYQKTRHNLGYRVVDLLAEKHKTKFKGGKGEYLHCRIEVEGRKVYLLKPLTFMNASGQAVFDSLRFFNLTPPELFVICDDVALPFGSLRIREKGSDGGHKGLRSIIYQLGTEEFPRLRLGIGPAPEGVDLEDFVLQRFKKEEKKSVEELIQRGSQAVESSIILGVRESMNRFNKDFDRSISEGL